MLIGLTANHRKLLPYYAVMATVGSLLGCLLTDVVCRKGGEKGLENRVSRRRLNYVKRKIQKNAGWALALASLMPPPFPFTPFVMAASALQYPRAKLLLVIGGFRFTRFLVEGLLGIYFGRQILEIAQTPYVQYAILILFVLSILGSVLSVYHWIQRSQSAVR